MIYTFLYSDKVQYFGSYSSLSAAFLFRLLAHDPCSGNPSVSGLIKAFSQPACLLSLRRPLDCIV